MFDNLKSFPQGGVHPPENKLSAKAAIQELPLPATVTIPITQHIGKPPKIVVKKGQAIKVGEVIAIHEGFVSANTHASVSGKVTKIEEVADAGGFKKTAITIKVQGDEWLEEIDRSDTLHKLVNLEKEEIVKKIMEGGVVGLGGATFPSHVKLSVPEGKKVEYLIINGVECEPYLTADHRLMLEKALEIIVGVRILMKALEVDKAIIGIEDNKDDAIYVMQSILQMDKQISVQGLEVQYPQGGEKQLIKALLNREVPAGGLPIDVGAVVHNVGTTFAVYEAVQKNKPLIERVLTVTGKSVEKPSNFLVRIGTPVADVLAAVGGIPEDTGKIIAGGPMMGKAIASTSVPVTKSTSGILLIPKEEAARTEVYTCIRCSKCIEACPMGLEPFRMMLLTQKGMSEKAAEEHILDCIECGSCAFVCPSNRPILDYMRLGKSKAKKL